MAGRLPKGHSRRGLVLPLRQHIAAVDLDRLAKLKGLLTDIRQLRAAEPDVLPLAVALKAKDPGSLSPFVDLQKQPVAVLIGAGIRESGLDRDRREFAHGIYPHTFFPHFGEPMCGGKPLLPHASPTLRSGCRQIAPDACGRCRHLTLGFLGFLGGSADTLGWDGGGQGWVRTSVGESPADLQSAAFNHSATCPLAPTYH